MRLVVVLVLCVALEAGCGTICNLTSGNPEVPFGGVQKDLEVLQTPRTDGGRLSNPSGKGAPAIFLAALLPAELVLSGVSDMVTLPLALYLLHRDNGETNGGTMPAESAAKE
jgi:uncharacterized protein YceK